MRKKIKKKTYVEQDVNLSKRRELINGKDLVLEIRSEKEENLPGAQTRMINQSESALRKGAHRNQPMRKPRSKLSPTIRNQFRKSVEVER